jgi:hypothetical protein
VAWPLGKDCGGQEGLEDREVPAAKRRWMEGNLRGSDLSPNNSRTGQGLDRSKGVDVLGLEAGGGPTRADVVHPEGDARQQAQRDGHAHHLATRFAVGAVDVDHVRFNRMAQALLERSQFQANGLPMKGVQGWRDKAKPDLLNGR